MVFTACIFPLCIFLGTGSAAYTRMRFTIECLHDLDTKFKEIGTRLFCFRGDPKDIITMLINVSTHYVFIAYRTVYPGWFSVQFMDFRHFVSLSDTGNMGGLAGEKMIPNRVWTRGLIPACVWDFLETHCLFSVWLAVCQWLDQKLVDQIELSIRLGFDNIMWYFILNKYKFIKGLKQRQMSPLQRQTRLSQHD